MAFHSQPNNTMLTAYHREAGTMRVQCRHPAERYPGCRCPGTTFLVRPEYCIPRPSKYPEMVFYLTILILVQFLGGYLESLGPHTIATFKIRTMMIYLINQRMESTSPTCSNKTTCNGTKERPTGSFNHTSLDKSSS